MKRSCEWRGLVRVVGGSERISRNDSSHSIHGDWHGAPHMRLEESSMQTIHKHGQLASLIDTMLTVSRKGILRRHKCCPHTHKGLGRVSTIAPQGASSENSQTKGIWDVQHSVYVPCNSSSLPMPHGQVLVATLHDSSSPLLAKAKEPPENHSGGRLLLFCARSSCTFS
eukprot:861941-Amphidinium_carterae.1